MASSNDDLLAAPSAVGAAGASGPPAGASWPPGDPRAPVDPRIDLPGREGLTGTAPAELYKPLKDPEVATLPPDGGPLWAQPQWRKDFPVDWPQDHYVARRDFARFLALTSLAFATGQVWIGVQSLVRRQKGAPPALKIAPLASIAAGSALVFRYPTEHDPCLLVRTREGELLAYSQACTHLSCAVVPKLDEGVLHCPCHEGYFDLKTGANIAGPPPRPLPKITLEVRGGDVYATGVERRAG